MIQCKTKCKETFISEHGCECDESYNGKKDWCYTSSCNYPYLKSFLGKQYDSIETLH